MQTKKYNYILQVEYIQYYKPTNRIFILRSYNRGITRYEFKIDRAVQLPMLHNQDSMSYHFVLVTDMYIPLLSSYP